MKTKKSVLNIPSFAFILFGVALILTISSCTKNGELVNPAVSDDAQKFLGTWHVSDNAARLNYDVTIERNPLNEKTEIFLNNFAGLTGKVKGLVVGNSVVIEKQGTGNDNYHVEGTGTYKSKSRLEFTYTLDDNIDSEVRNAVFSQ